MKNKIKRVGIGIGAVVILLGARASFSEPGSQSDPLVTFGYVETKFRELENYIDSKFESKENNKEAVWQTVELDVGQSLIGKAGTEIILRGGKASSISKISNIVKDGVAMTVDNGLTDVTDGRDLKMGDNVPLDHLLIIPRDDGRGIKCSSYSFLLVKGDYSIK